MKTDYLIIKKTKCERCKGKGQLPPVSVEGVTSFYNERTNPKGKGEIIPQCEKCHGTGKIMTEYELVEALRELGIRCG